MKLIPMTDYVIEQIHKRESIGQCWLSVTKYAQFLKQPIKLEMFLPCDKDGNILQEPTDQYNTPQYYEAEMFEYQNAQEKVIFKNVNRRRLYSEGTFALDVSGKQIAHYKSKPNYWVGMDKNIEDLCGMELELKEGWKNKALAEI